VTAGNEKQIQAVIDNGLLDAIVGALATGNFQCQKEATWALCNLASGGSPQQLGHMINSGALPPLTLMLGSSDQEMIIVILDAFKNILKSEENLGRLLQMVEYLESIGFVNKVEELQSHENQQVYETAVSIIDTYWSGEVI